MPATGRDCITRSGCRCARGARQEVVRTAQKCVAERGTFVVALSGGSTPKAMYELLARDEELYAAMPWWQTHWFWGDERNVPPDSPESNYRMAHEAMLAKSPTPPANIHRVPAELNSPVETALLYDANIRSTMVKLGRPVDPVASFDLLLLGIGTDGHTASLFPGTSALDETDRLFAENYVQELDVWRFTITPPTLGAAERAMVLVSGHDKASVLAYVLRGGFDPKQYPAQLVTKRSASTVWLVDEPAATQLTQSAQV